MSSAGGAAEGILGRGRRDLMVLAVPLPSLIAPGLHSPRSLKKNTYGYHGYTSSYHGYIVGYHDYTQMVTMVTLTEKQSG